MCDNETLDWSIAEWKYDTARAEYEKCKHADDIRLLRSALNHPMRTRDPSQAKLFFCAHPTERSQLVENTPKILDIYVSKASNILSNVSVTNTFINISLICSVNKYGSNVTKDVIM